MKVKVEKLGNLSSDPKRDPTPIMRVLSEKERRSEFV